jgi:protein TonB
MMYRSDLDTRHKGSAIAAVAALHAGLALALLHLTGTVDLTDVQEGLAVFDVIEAVPPPPVPPPPPPPPRESQAEKPKEREGGSAPKNIRSEATPVVAPKPRIEVPATPPIAASETPREGTAPTQGASDIAGPGTGAGGTGTGTGSGAGGGGPGGGGEGLAAVRTRLATRPLRGRDFPPHILEAWPAGASIYMRHRVDANGTIVECIVDNGTGDSAIDRQICEITRQKLRYRPGLNRNRQRVADWAGYGQRPPR